MTTTAPRAAPTPAGRHEEPPLRRSTGRAVLTGNEAILKGALEAGVSLITGYPGSPVAEVFPACEREAPYLAELGTEAVLADNEAQAAAMLNGARQVPGARSLAVMKSVGAYVALDGLAIANAARSAPGAAAVVVVGDDPGLSSTQVGADSRLTLAAGRIPVVEPATPQELKDFVRLAFELSEGSGLIVGVVTTTIQADGVSVIDLGPNIAPLVGPRSRATIATGAIDATGAVSLPPQAGSLEVDILERRIPLLHACAADLGIDRTEGPAGGRLGIVTSGAAYPLVRDALAFLDMDGELPLLRLGLTWPVAEWPIAEFARHVDEIVVVEERAASLEDQVRRIAAPLGVQVHGKALPGGPGFPPGGILTPDLVRARFAALVVSRPAAAPARSLARAEALRAPHPSVEPVGTPARTPTYCAGCPHRGTSSPLIEIRRRLADPDYMARVHGREPVDVIAHGGIGCYSMAFLPPWNEMHDLSAMGLGGATGAGSAPLVTNRHYVLVGDGTFFHGEMATMANAVKQRQDILYIVLDNKTTAMTGHQGTPGSATDLMGRPQQPVEIERVVRAMGVPFVARANPDDREGYMALLERAFLMDGTRVVISDKECAITKGRRDRVERAAVLDERGFLPLERHINIARDTCENCRACTTATGCPGLTLVDTPLGEKVAIDRETCVDDAYCARIKACPSFEQVTVRRRRAPRSSPALLLGGPALPDPPRPVTDGTFRISVPGVGGSGVGVASRVLIEAAAAEWPAVDAYQKKGLAQRGGSVHAHIVLHDGTRPRPAMFADGEIDLVVALEPHEALRALAGGDPGRTAAVVNSAPRPTTGMLVGSERLVRAVADGVATRTRPGGAVVLDLSELCESQLGSRQAANIAALGAAYQAGLLPLSGPTLEAAIAKVSGRRHAAANLAAFGLGRRVSASPDVADEAPSLAVTVDTEAAFMRPSGRREAYLAAVRRAASEDHLGEPVLSALAVRLPDLLAWGGASYAERYLDAVLAVADVRPDLAVPAAHNLHRVMAIKDEVFVAHLLTSPKKYALDRERFAIDPTAGDRLGYVHFNRVRLPLGRRAIEFDVRTRDWMLRLMRPMRFLRTVLPQWHREERAFRDWYLGTVIPAVRDGALAASAAAEAIDLPGTVRGFRDIRRPGEERARRRFAELITSSSTKAAT